MGLTRINNNIAAINANRNLNSTGRALQVSLERLSSGLRINRAADDAAGLSISENLRAQINGLNRAIDNASEAINLVNTAEGALAETTNRLQRIRVLAVQAANTGTNDATALQALQDEIETSIAEITRIGDDTQFGTRRLINGDNANAATFLESAAGISLANGPTVSTLSTGQRFLAITQTNAGSETLSTGTDGNDNSGATTFTGSTFDSGTFELALNNVRDAAAREVTLGLTITQSGATPTGADNLLDEGGVAAIFVDSAGGSFTVGTTDIFRFVGTESDGAAFTFTVSATAGGLSIDGIVTAINVALATDSASFDTAAGQIVITAGTTGLNSLSYALTIDDDGGGGGFEFAAANSVLTAGNDNDGVLTFGGGAAVQVTQGDIVTVQGPTPSDTSQPAPQITFTLAAGTLTEGTDLVTIVAQAFQGVLEGGQTVTFQNGDRDVRFRSGDSGGFAAGESISLDFAANIDLDGGTNRTFVISAVNNSLNFQIGANQGQRVAVAFGDLRATNLGFTGETQPNGNDRTVAGITVLTLTGANEALAIVDEALDQVNEQRSALGAFTNRLEATIANLGVASENLTASESRIRDADIAFETTRFTRNQILLQAGISILAQANLQPQNVLALLA